MEGRMEGWMMKGRKERRKAGRKERRGHDLYERSHRDGYNELAQ